MEKISVSSALLLVETSGRLTPAMVSVAWEISACLDEQRKPGSEGPQWLTIPSKRLRGEMARSDNVWLRQCLERLTQTVMVGEHQDHRWGAALIAEWHIREGGAVVEVMIPPASVMSLNAPQTFAKIEQHAAHSLRGYSRKLYGILADKKRLRQWHWTFGLDELRRLLGVDHLKAYKRFNHLRQRVLDPAVEAINDFGTVDLTMTPQRLGRSINAVRFEWRWKDPHNATETTIENERHSKARRKSQDTADAPPMIEDQEQAEPALTWWHGLTDADRENWGNRVGRTVRQEGPGGKLFTITRREADIARAAYEEVSANAGAN